MEARILIFKRATPESTTYFSGAHAILYVEGGLLSHACCVARERNIACATRLGWGFLEELQNRMPAELRVVVGEKCFVEFLI